MWPSSDIASWAPNDGIECRARRDRSQLHRAKIVAHHADLHARPLIGRLGGTETSAFLQDVVDVDEKDASDFGDCNRATTHDTTPMSGLKSFQVAHLRLQIWNAFRLVLNQRETLVASVAAQSVAAVRRRMH